MLNKKRKWKVKITISKHNSFAFNLQSRNIKNYDNCKYKNCAISQRNLVVLGKYSIVTHWIS